MNSWYYFLRLKQLKEYKICKNGGVKIKLTLKTFNFNENIPLGILKQIIDNEHLLQLQLHKDCEDNVIVNKFTIDEFNEYRADRKMIYSILYNPDINRLYGHICYFLNINEIKPPLYYEYYNKNGIHISQLFVNSSYRNNGVAQNLIGEIERYAKHLNISDFDLNTTAKNIVAQNLYKKLNFNIIFSTLSNKKIQRLTSYENDYILLNSIDNEINTKINNSIRRLMNYFDNGFTFNEIKDHIMKRINNNDYTIIKSNNDLYAIISINYSKNRIDICDFLLDYDKYNLTNLTTLLDCIYRCALSKNLKEIKTAAPIKESDYLKTNFNFIEKVYHLYKGDAQLI